MGFDIGRHVMHLEKAVHGWVRRLPPRGRHILSAALVTSAAFATAFPLTWAWVASFEDAGAMCEERYAHLVRDYIIPSFSDHVPESVVEIFSSASHCDLLPFHYLNVTATMVSLAHTVIWLHYSSHRTDESRDLDRKSEK